MIENTKENHLKESKMMEIKKPNSCILLITLRCNLRCKVCYLWANKEDPSQYPSIDEWKRFLDSIDSFAEKPFTIIFGGGEPLLDKEKLLNLMSYASQKGFRISLATSGYYMDEATVKQLCGAGLHYCAFSLYSLSDKKQSYLRGVKGSVKRVKNAVKYFSRYGPHVEIAIDTVLMEPNRRHILKLTEWVKNNKAVSHIMFQVVMQPFHTKPDEKWYFDGRYKFLWPKEPGKMTAVIDSLIDIKILEEEEGGGKINNSVAQFRIFKDYFTSPNKFIKKEVCPTYNNGNFGVAPDGAVTLCPYIKPIGNIKKQSLDEIWFSDESRRRREEIRHCVRNCHHIVNCWYEEE